MKQNKNNEIFKQINQNGRHWLGYHGGPNWAKNENSLKTLKSGFILCETSFLVNINTFPICDNLKKNRKKFCAKKFLWGWESNPAPLW